jgi:hypothetical protein
MDGQHTRPVDPTGLQTLQRSIGLSQRKPLRPGPDGDCCRFPEKIHPILTRIGGHTRNCPLAEELTIIVDRRNRAHVNARQRQSPSALQGAQGWHDQFAGWRKDNRPV